MIQLLDLSKSFGRQTLFSSCTLNINGGEKIGLVGRNGHGKTTLLRMIIGEEEPDSGEIIVPKGYCIGFLRQHISLSGGSVLAEVVAALPEEAKDEIHRAKRVLSGLGFSEMDLEQPTAAFSGGYQLRMQLAKLLVSEPQLLLLDEPTNYLDIVSVRWLSRELQSWRGELLMVSHDREFMDAITTHTVGIHRGQVRKVKGGTEAYYRVVAEEEEVYEKTRQNEERRREELERFIERFRAKASKARAAQSRVKELERLGVKEQLAAIESLEFKFQEQECPAKVLLEANDLAFGYSEDDLLFSGLSLRVKKGDRIGIVGKNGRGKSTLLRVLAGEIEPLAGEIRSHPRTRIGYFGQTNIQRLTLSATVEEEIAHANPELSRTQVRAIAGSMMFDGELAEKRIEVLSGGERSRVLLGKIVATPNNILLLDEPTNHLDFAAIASVQESLQQFSGAVIVVSHLESLLRDLVGELIVFDGDGGNRSGATLFHGTYQEFLERVGWRDERESVVGGSVSDEAVPKGAALRAAAKEREREERRRAKEMAALEEEMLRYDKLLQENSEALLRAAAEGNGVLVGNLGSERKRLEEEQLKVISALEELLDSRG